MAASLDIMSLYTDTQSLFVYSPYSDKISTKTLANKDSSKAIKTLSKAEVMYLYDSKTFTDSDLQLAKIVAKNIFCTVPMLVKSLAHFTKYKTKNNTIAIMNEYASESARQLLRGRLDVLVSANILNKYFFPVKKIRNGEEVSGNMGYYLVSPHGYNFLKRILNFNDNYDEYLSITPLEDVFKYLTTSTICQAFYEIPGFIDYNIDIPFYCKTQKKLTRIYGAVTLEKDDSKYKIIVEPVKFNFNQFRITQQEWEKFIHEHLEVLKAYLDGLLVKQKQFRVLIACEDIEGLQNSAKLIYQYLKDYLPYIYFTMDAIAFSYGVDKTCIQMKENGNLIPKVLDILV
ncbi:MAG: hypothetical protein AB7G87_03775 [Clostridia bacterium]